MKCEHGYEVVVSVSSSHPLCWDNGVVVFNEHGQQHLKPGGYLDNGDEYMPVVGCPICTVVKVAVPE